MPKSKKTTHTVTWNKQPLESIKKPPLLRRLEVWWCGIGYPHYPTEHKFLRFCARCGFDRGIVPVPMCECEDIVRGKYCRSCGKPTPFNSQSDLLK